jgi:cytochrome c oxidase assembly factor CtaG
MITGVMLWWPIFKPIAEGRLLAMPAVVYMFMAAAISTTLGIIFTMADTPYYACYANPHDEIEGTLKLIREDWGLSQLDDQKMGGAIMWEPAGAVFLWAIMVVTLDWLKEESEVHQVKTVKQEIKNKVVEGSSESV